jgi:hypothetical protein
MKQAPILVWLVPLVILAVALCLLLVRWTTRSGARALMQNIAQAGAVLLDDSWKLGFGSCAGQARLGDHAVSFVGRFGRFPQVFVSIVLPRPVGFSPLLKTGTPLRAGWAGAEAERAFGLGRDWLDPPEARVLHTPETARRLESHPRWKTARLVLSADRVDLRGVWDPESPEQMREGLEMLVLLANRALALQTERDARYGTT